MIEGRIVKGIGGFYYVNTNIGSIECTPRGVFRKTGQTPLVGDMVLISIIDSSDMEGVIEEILPRENVLLRPNVANVQQCVVIVAAKRPKPDLLLLDRLLILADAQGMARVVCFNKTDLDREGENENIISRYRQAGYKVLSTSVKTGQGIDKLGEMLKDRISVFAGVSGVGKSSILNSLQPGLDLKVGEISPKLKRGRHTTRHAELLELSFGGMVVDTPGFSSLNLSGLQDLTGLEDSQFSRFYPEFDDVSRGCKFIGCKHINEPNCAVKRAVEKGEIAVFRYENYRKLLEELQRNRRKKYD